MASIIIATVPIHGHVVPLLAVARHFAERGDRVRFVTGARFAAAVAATGAEHIPLPPEADFDDREDLRSSRSARDSRARRRSPSTSSTSSSDPVGPSTTRSSPRTATSLPTHC